MSACFDRDWVFQQGDNRAWQIPDFDHSDWQAVDVPALLRLNPAAGIVGWYRLRFDWDQRAAEPLALFIGGVRRADETWLNGEKIGGLGRFGEPWQFFNSQPQSLPRLYPIAPELLRQGQNTLAIRVYIGFAETWGALFPGASGIHREGVCIANAATLEAQSTASVVRIAAIDVMMIVLGFADLVLIVFLLRGVVYPFPEFRWLLLGSLLLFMGSVGHDLLYLLRFHWLPTDQLFMASMLLVPLANALYFWAQQRDIPTRLMQLLGIVWVLAVIIVLAPGVGEWAKTLAWKACSLLVPAALFYALYCAVLAVRDRRTGGVAQLLGLLVYMLSIRTQWLPTDVWAHRNIQIGSVVFRFALLIAYFQALWQLRRDFSAATQGYLRRIEESRKAVSRDLHDGIGQRLASSKLLLSLARQQADSDYLSDLNKEIDASIVDLRHALGELSGPTDAVELNKLIQQECSDLQQRNELEFELHLQDILLPSEQRHHVYRIVQECIHNAIRHGKAEKLRIDMHSNTRMVTLCVADNGRGFDPAKAVSTSGGHYGLQNIKARAALLGGRVVFRSRRGGGSEIEVLFPQRLSDTD